MTHIKVNGIHGSSLSGLAASQDPTTRARFNVLCSFARSTLWDSIPGSMVYEFHQKGGSQDRVVTHCDTRKIDHTRFRSYANLET